MQEQVPPGLVVNWKGDCVAPPGVNDLSPRAGDYGTTVTITGHDLGNSSDPTISGLTILCSDPQKNQLTFTLGQQPVAPNYVIQSWTDTKIVVRYPFPCVGPLTVSMPNGQATTPAFQPSWLPGAALAYAAPDENLHASAALPQGRVVLGIQNITTNTLRLVIGGKGTWTELKLPGIPAGLRYLTLFPDANGQPEGFFLDGTDPPQAYYLQTSGSQVTFTPTGVHAISLALGFLAGGRDTIGPYLWIRDSATTVARYRPLPTTWTRERGPITMPTNGPFGFGVTADGSAVVSWTKYQSVGVFFWEYLAQYAWLTPMSTMFGNTIDGSSWGGSNPQRECMVRAPTGQRMRRYGCPQQLNTPPYKEPIPRNLTPTGWETPPALPNDASMLCTPAYASTRAAIAGAYCTAPDGGLVLALDLSNAARMPLKLWGAVGSYLFVGDDDTITLLSLHTAKSANGTSNTVLYAPLLTQ